MASPLSADQIIVQFEALIDDSLDTTTELFLLNQVKDSIESKRAWEWLKKLDLSQTASISDTFQTPHTLPSDFIKPSESGIYITGDMIPYKQIPFESQIKYQSITYVYFIDFLNQKFYLGGSPGRNGAIQFFYQAASPSLALISNGGSPWIFPAKFHPILPFAMAKKYFAIDQGDKSRSWDDRWTTFMQEMEEDMNAWDSELQTLAQQNDANMGGMVDFSGYPNIIDMDRGGGGTISG